MSILLKCATSEIESTVLSNGFWSSFLGIKRGLRQGDPLSCGIFDLVVEIIAIKIRENQDIEGIKIKDVVKKLGQYADDLWVSMLHKKSCYTALFKEFGDFTKVTGLKINYDKTEILRLGSLRNTDAMYYADLPLKWSDSPIKILGIQVIPDMVKMMEINFNELLVKSKRIINIWS